MARIRSTKPSIWGDMGPLSRDARLLLLILQSLADDEGRFIATPTAIKGFGYPYDNIADATIRKWLNEITKHCGSPVSSVPRLHLYQVDGREYGVLLNFKKHQRISHPQESSLPPPQGELFHA